jgi:hypothetical protein
MITWAQESLKSELQVKSYRVLKDKDIYVNI